jgi:hypothetical protein
MSQMHAVWIARHDSAASPAITQIEIDLQIIVAIDDKALYGRNVRVQVIMNFSSEFWSIK